MTEWWDRQKEIPYKDLNFQKIIDFYLFNCPCEIEKRSKKKEAKTYTRVSKHGTTFRTQGWSGGYLNTLLASMKHTDSGHLEYHTFNNKADICSEVENIETGISLKDRQFEMIAISVRTDMNKTSAIFYYIRNAFAHGTFSYLKDKKVYYFESSKNNTVKARIRLREETMLQWIQNYKLSPKNLKLILSNKRRQKKKHNKKGIAA